MTRIAFKRKIKLWELINCKSTGARVCVSKLHNQRHRVELLKKGWKQKGGIWLSGR